jgi:hypothetical protein
VVYPQDLMLVRQVLYHLSQPLTLNVFVYWYILYSENIDIKC